MDKLTKIQQVALTMLKATPEIILYHDSTQQDMIVKAFEFAQMFIETSADKEMTWNQKGVKK